MFTFEPERQPARFTEVHIENLAATIAVEMVVRRDVPVVARRAERARNLVNQTIGDENLEIAIDGTERERRGLRQQCAMDVGGGRMRIASPNPMQDRLSLTRAITARSGGNRLGG